MKNLFIDTNIYLTFFHFSSDDLEELKKLLVAVRNVNIKLFITEQVINEFGRNREAKIIDALDRFINQKLQTNFHKYVNLIMNMSSLGVCLNHLR